MNKSYVYFVSYQFNVVDESISGYGNTTVNLTQKITSLNIANSFKIIQDKITEAVSKNSSVNVDADQVSVVVLNFILLD